MNIVNLLTNQLNNPLGYDFQSIHLSWQVKDALADFSEEVQIRISESENMDTLIYDSGIMKGFKECSYSVPIKCKPRTRYYWQVWIKDAKEEAISEAAYFESGKCEEEWKAHWIGVNEQYLRMPYISKEFETKQQIQKARVYLYGVGLYEAYLNNKYIGEEYLKPGYHSYDLLMEYQTYDITDYVKTGNNKFEIILGEGWYKGRFGFEGGFENLYGDQKKCIVEIYLTFSDGSEECISSGSDWTARESSILANNIYDGESIDETLPSEELKLLEIQDTKDLLVERYNPPIKKTEKISPFSITSKEGYFLIDFGEIITGWVEFAGDFEKGQEISLFYGEVLQNQEFYNENLRTAKAEFHYVSDGDRKTIRPHFTFYGFRYVKIVGIKDIEGYKFEAFRIMSEHTLTGSITTSNEKVNQLFRNTLRSQQCNFLDIPTDCPQRDERMGWTGDAGIFARTACFHMQSGAFFHHYMINLKKEQELLQGAVPFFVPKPKIDPFDGINPFYISSGASVWGDAATLIPWTLYDYYGNKEMLKEHYPAMTAWVDYITTRTKENAKPYLWQNDRQLGDWLALDNNNPNSPIGKTDSGFIASAFYYYSATLCAKAAKEIADERENEFTSLAEHIRVSFFKEFFDEAYQLTIEETQTACAMLLYLKLYPMEAKDILIQTLERLLKDNNYHLNTGFVGTPILCLALSEHGLNSLAYKLLLNEEYPSWLYEVNLGATTIWERWNSLLEDGSISGTDMNSLNHYVYGSIADWMYRFLCGFQPCMHKDIKMIIRPMPERSIESVSGYWDSPYGRYHCEWKYDDQAKVHYKVEIPYNANANLIFTNGVSHLLQHGRYCFNHEGELEMK